jgi:hypothetical protein
MTPIRFLLIALAVALPTGGPLLAEGEHHAPAPVQDPRFEFLKGLAGTWIGPAVEEGGPPNTVEFRVTAGGHAVEEREFLGTPMEMVTLYHMEGRDLVGTHYCMIGNRPQVKAAKQVVDGALAFACAGKPGGAASHDEEHVHGWTMRLDREGRLHYGGEMMKSGEVSETPSMILTRQSATASR